MKHLLISLLWICNSGIYALTNFENIQKTSPLIATETFKTTMAQHPLAVVKFYADWCPACRQVASIFKNVSSIEAYEEIGFYEINYDTFASICKEEKIKSIPTVLIFKNGQRVKTIIGKFTDKSLSAAIEDQLT